MAYTYKYPRPAVTADCVVMTREAEPKVLLIQRGDEPFKGGWAFPGGFMNMDETTEQCAIRELQEETGLRVSKIKQIGAYSKVDRDPRGRTITVAYLAIVDEPMAATGQDDAAQADWWTLSNLPRLAFDHYDIMQDAIRVYAQAMEENEKTPHDRFKEQKERMHELSKEIREQCAHVQELCNNYTKRSRRYYGTEEDYTLNDKKMDTYKLIDLNEYVQTGEGGSSLTYSHKTRNALAKLFNPGAEAEMAEREFMTSRSVFDMGISTPEPYQLITDGKRRGVEYELIKNKRSFTRIISEEPSRLEEISLAFARMTRELHATKADTSRIPSVKDVLRDFYLEKDLVTEEYKQRALAFLDKAPESTNCLHGDLHIGNIITDGERVLWIDLGMFCYGVPEWDLGWTWTMCNRIDDKRADFILHLTPEMLTAHWNIFLPAYLGTNDKAAIGEYIKRILPFYAVKLPYMFDMVLQSRLPDEALKALPQVIV